MRNTFLSFLAMRTIKTVLRQLPPSSIAAAVINCAAFYMRSLSILLLLPSCSASSLGKVNGVKNEGNPKCHQNFQFRFFCTDVEDGILIDRF